MLIKTIKYPLLATLVALIAGCSDSSPGLGLNDSQVEPTEQTEISLNEKMVEAIELSTGESVIALIMPASDDFENIPQDPSNPLSVEKVALGKFLYHDTGFATEGNSNEEFSWSCASCHHAAAGFKSGIPQGIGEGGQGFGIAGTDRTLSPLFDGNAPADSPLQPDIQPFASPTVLNTAYQDVMLWNGQFGNASGSINTGIDESILSTPGTPKEANAQHLSGLETQALAGLGVHRMRVTDNSALQTNQEYMDMFTAAYGAGSSNVKIDAAKAIAAYERTVLSNQAPFQLWLNEQSNSGASADTSILSDKELRGGILFFGNAGCADCHQGPALSSKFGASENEMFMSVGFADLDTENNPRAHGEVKVADSQGRAGFTTNSEMLFSFKISQLYNLADSDVFGHGASFNSVREVLDYKNQAVSQNGIDETLLDQRFIPLGLSDAELDDLDAFLTLSLRDPNLSRYQPDSVPSGNCIIVDPLTMDDGILCQ